ncbi:HNH endonuclease [Bacillus sp. OE]|uniref:HNH endonuclease n=1 Tax=Bacillus sp. OE TaxID=2293320 RepID=UPI000E2F72B5|nr:HNH endonuclease [Bacillus sp. OE]
MTKTCFIEGCESDALARGVCNKHYLRYKKTGSFDKKPCGNKVDFDINENGCFICVSHATSSNGYFGLTKNRKRYSMHRFIYEEMFGEIPEGLVVMHKCDNKKCINPEHMELGTIADNTKDASKRNLIPKGSSHHNSKLTEDVVREIKRRLRDGETPKSLSEKYNTSYIGVIKIKNGKSWKHVSLEKGV